MKHINKFMSYGWCSIKGNYIPKGECVTLADHEFELNAVTAQRDEALSELITAREDYRQSLLARSFETEQRDRLIEAIKEHKATMQHRQEFHDSKLYDALQSLTTNEQ